MKPVSLLLELIRAEVAPRTGAWIETKYCRASCRVKNVAPRTGAWIETLSRH